MTKNAIGTLDSFDRAILAMVQANNLHTHAEIGKAVNLSASSVRRRLAAMRKNGTIIGDVSLTDPSKQGLTFLVHVSFEREAPEIYDAFAEQMTADAAVSQCYYISGEDDFMLIVHATTPEAYEAWGTKHLMANSAIRRYSTSLVWKRAKFTTNIAPVE